MAWVVFANRRYCVYGASTGLLLLLSVATLSTIGGVASVAKSFKGILSNVLKCLGDNKKRRRECTLSTLDSWLAVVHLDKMIVYITAVLTDAKLCGEGRKDLFDWLSKQLSVLVDFPDAINLLKPAATSMTDKSAEVRKSAEVCFGEILRICGHELVSKNLKDIQGPALAIVVERLKPYGGHHELESGRATSGMSSRGIPKMSKTNGHGDRPTRHGSKITSSVWERIIVRRFKFEELRLEKIQELECGHNIERVREKVRELIKQIIHTYSAAKTFPYILEGLRSRNNRTRTGSADLVGYLLDNHGAEIVGQMKSLQIVASLTAERDGETRKAALNTLATGYKILGDDVWRYVGKLTEAQRSMLDNRFKWKARDMDKRKEGKPGEGRTSLRRSVWDNVYANIVYFI